MYLFLQSIYLSLWFIFPSLRRQCIYLFLKYHYRNHENMPFNLISSSSPLVNIFFKSPKLITTYFRIGPTILTKDSQLNPRLTHLFSINLLYFLLTISRIQHFTTFIVMFFWQSSFGYLFLLPEFLIEGCSLNLAYDPFYSSEMGFSSYLLAGGLCIFMRGRSEGGEMMIKLLTSLVFYVERVFMTQIMKIKYNLLQESTTSVKTLLCTLTRSPLINSSTYFIKY